MKPATTDEFLTEIKRYQENPSKTRTRNRLWRCWVSRCYQIGSIGEKVGGIYGGDRNEGKGKVAEVGWKPG
jgi:hypothetical protein